MTLMTDFYQEKKAELKADYISGFTPKEIAVKYGFKNKECIYYYLHDLTPEERGIHVTNYYKRKATEKQMNLQGKEVQNAESQKVE
jgi:hypothetical protein